MIMGTEITESLSVLLILYTEELNKKVMQEFLETLSAGRYQDAKKQDPQVLLLICSSKLEFVNLRNQIESKAPTSYHSFASFLDFR